MSKLKNKSKTDAVKAMYDALYLYANKENWLDNKFMMIKDICEDDTNFYHCNGELARRALKLYRSVFKN